MPELERKKEGTFSEKIAIKRFIQIFIEKIPQSKIRFPFIKKQEKSPRRNIAA